jgi:hypothetical protein
MAVHSAPRTDRAPRSKPGDPWLLIISGSAFFTAGVSIFVFSDAMDVPGALRIPALIIAALLTFMGPLIVFAAVGVGIEQGAFRRILDRKLKLLIGVVIGAWFLIAVFERAAAFSPRGPH